MAAGWRSGAPLIWNSGVVERLEHGLNHPVKLISTFLGAGGISAQLCSRLLLPSPRLQWCLLQQQFLEIVRRVKICLLARWHEHGLNLLPFQCLEIYGPEKGIIDERLPAGCADPFRPILFEQRAHCMHANIRYWWIGDWVVGLALYDGLC